MSTSVVIALLAFATAVLAVGWAVAARRFARELRTLTEGMQIAAASGIVMRSPAGGELMSDGAANGLNHVREALEIVHTRALDSERAHRALESDLLRRDKLTAIGYAAAMIAHQLGSPLQVLHGRARAIAASPNLSVEVVRCARIIEEQADRMTVAIERLLPLGRRQSVPAVALDLPGALAPVVEVLETDARRRGIRLQFVCRHAIPRVMADADELQQVIVNLVVNACRATPSGGRVRVLLSRGWMTSPDQGRQRAVRIAVTDTGGGIPPTLRDRIFEPFFTTWEEQGGLGLGLTIVSTIVRKHAGHIDVASKPEKGTTVTIELPALAGAAEALRRVPVNELALRRPHL